MTSKGGVYTTQLLFILVLQWPVRVEFINPAVVYSCITVTSKGGVYTTQLLFILVLQ